MGHSPLEIPPQVKIAAYRGGYDQQTDKLGGRQKAIPQEAPISIPSEELEKEAKDPVTDQILAECLPIELTFLEESVQYHTKEKSGK